MLLFYWFSFLEQVFKSFKKLDFTMLFWYWASHWCEGCWLACAVVFDHRNSAGIILKKKKCFVLLLFWKCLLGLFQNNCCNIYASVFSSKACSQVLFVVAIFVWGFRAARIILLPSFYHGKGRIYFSHCKTDWKLSLTEGGKMDVQDFRGEVWANSFSLKVMKINCPTNDQSYNRGSYDHFVLLRALISAAR